MERHKDLLLLVDAIINLILGTLLLLFPFGVAEWLGLPSAGTDFYAMILGGVLFGIGLALLIEKYGDRHSVRGLGVGGAIAINLSGALVLLGWLIAAPFELPMRGYVILWTVAVTVLLVAVTEILAK